MAKGTPSRNSFYEVDCEGFAPNFFFLLFQNHSLLILSRLSNQVWTWWQEPLYLLHCGETFQSRRTRSSCWGAHLQMVFMNKKAVTCNRHVRVHTCAYICSLPQVYFALQFKCAELPETGRKKNSLIPLKTPCAASELFLVP